MHIYGDNHSSGEWGKFWELQVYSFGGGGYSNTYNNNNVCIQCTPHTYEYISGTRPPLVDAIRNPITTGQHDLEPLRYDPET